MEELFFDIIIAGLVIALMLVVAVVLSMWIKELFIDDGLAKKIKLDTAYMNECRNNAAVMEYRAFRKTFYNNPSKWESKEGCLKIYYTLDNGLQVRVMFRRRSEAQRAHKLIHQTGNKSLEEKIMSENKLDKEVKHGKLFKR